MVKPRRGFFYACLPDREASNSRMAPSGRGTQKKSFNSVRCPELDPIIYMAMEATIQRPPSREKILFLFIQSISPKLLNAVEKCKQPGILPGKALPAGISGMSTGAGPALLHNRPLVVFFY